MIVHHFHEAGRISTGFYVDGDITVADDIYPLCGDTVETRIDHRRGEQCKVQPQTYTRRVIME